MAAFSSLPSSFTFWTAPGGVEEALGRRARQALEELGALDQGLGVRVDPPDPRERDLRDAEEAVLDRPDLLAHDGELRDAQEGVRLVDAPGDGVLERQDAVLALLPLDRLDRLAERAVADEDRLLGAVTEELPPGEVAVGPLASLEGDTEELGLVLLVRRARQAALLLPHRRFDDVAEDPSRPGRR
jgi:hypothetical protein